MQKFALARIMEVRTLCRRGVSSPGSPGAVPAEPLLETRMGDDPNHSSYPMPPWRATDERPGVEEPYHIWAPRPLLRSIRWQPAQPTAPEAAAPSAEPAGTPEPAYEIFLDQRALEAMHEHVWGAPPDREPFGYLVGDLCLDSEAGRHYVIVEGVIPADAPLLDEADEPISPEAHRALRRAARSRRGVVAGWYRRRREGPPALTERDERLHERWFGKPWQAAVLFVTDPEAPAGSCFAPDKGGALSRTPLPFFELVGFDSLRARGVRRSRIEWINVITMDPVAVEPLPRPEVAAEESVAEAGPTEEVVAEAAATEAPTAGEPTAEETPAEVEEVALVAEVEEPVIEAEPPEPLVAAEAPVEAETRPQDVARVEPEQTEGVAPAAEAGESTVLDEAEELVPLDELLPEPAEEVAEELIATEEPVAPALSFEAPTLWTSAVEERTEASEERDVPAAEPEELITEPPASRVYSFDPEVGQVLWDEKEKEEEEEVPEETAEESLLEAEREPYAPIPEREKQPEPEAALPAEPREILSAHEWTAPTLDEPEPAPQEPELASREWDAHVPPPTPPVLTAPRKKRKSRRRKIRRPDARKAVARAAEVAAVLLAAGSIGIGARNLLTGAASLHFQSATARPPAHARGVVEAAKPGSAGEATPAGAMGATPEPAPTRAGATGATPEPAPATAGAAPVTPAADVARVEERPAPARTAEGRRQTERVADTPALRRVDRLGLGLQAVVNRYDGVAAAFDQRHIGCSELRTAYLAVEQGWLTYSAEGRARHRGRLPPALAERDRSLYLRVGEIDRHFNGAGCERP